MTTTDPVVDRVRDYVVAEFLPGEELSAVSLDQDLMSSGVVDSLGLLKLIAWVETTFDVTVGDDDLDPENFRDFGAIAQYVHRSTGQRVP